MKTINFNHESDKITEALGMTDDQGNELNTKCGELTYDMLKGKLPKPSVLAERILNEFSEEEKLMCIVQFLMNSLEQIVEKHPEVAYLTVNEDDIKKKIDELINED